MEEHNAETAEKNNKTSAKDAVCCYCHKHSSKLVICAGIAILLIAGGCMAFRFHDGNNELNRSGFAKERTIERSGFKGKMMGRNSDQMHRNGGKSGKINKIDGNNLIVALKNQEVTVIIEDETSIYSSNGNIASKSDLKVDQNIAISGRPNSNGQITANIIRIR